MSIDRPSIELDATDWKILKELQDDGRLTNVELARRAGLSAPPCLRRVRALEESGIIRGYRALLDSNLLGFDITCFAMVQLSSTAGHDLTRFETAIRAWPIVRECWSLSGDIDFLLKCVAHDLQSFQKLVLDLTSLPNVRNVRTALTVAHIKDAPPVPLEEVE